MAYVKKKHKLILVCILIFLKVFLLLKFYFNSKIDILHFPNGNQLNFSSIEYVLSSTICLFKKPKLLIIITSHIQNNEARSIIRNTYTKDLFDTFNAQIIFLLAQENKESNANIMQEFHHFNDIVQGNFQEAYKNLTYKHYMGLKWSRDRCTSAKYIVKMDDDIVVNYYVLFKILNRFKSKFDLMGYIIDNMLPIRDKNNKWYVSMEEFKAKIYPTFLSGWLYIASSSAVHLLLENSHSTKFFWIDDVFITGILREKAELKLTDIKSYFRTEPKNIECCISNKLPCDFVAAPSGKDYDLNRKLNDHLWQCRHKKNCSLEISKKKSCLFSDDFNSIQRGL